SSNQGRFAPHWDGKRTVCCDLAGAFFLSSSRRHTRWPRDWSSDVCSSDLLPPMVWPRGLCSPAKPSEEGGLEEFVEFLLRRASRSEERRVGKECRSRGSPEE